MHYMEMLRDEEACSPAMTWLGSNSGKTARELWDTCPDGSWQAWLLGLGLVHECLAPDALKGLRQWAMTTAQRAVTVHAPNALLSAAACHPHETHRDALIKHAEGLSALRLDGSAAAADARYAADAAAAADARYAADAAAAADARYAAVVAAVADARATERKQQADDIRACIKWEWVEEALRKAGVKL